MEYSSLSKSGLTGLPSGMKTDSVLRFNNFNPSSLPGGQTSRENKSNPTKSKHENTNKTALTQHTNTLAHFQTSTQIVTQSTIPHRAVKWFNCAALICVQMRRAALRCGCGHQVRSGSLTWMGHKSTTAKSHKMTKHFLHYIYHL